MISYPSLIKSYASYFDTPMRKSYLNLGISLLTLILLILMIYPAVFYVLDINGQLQKNREIDRLLTQKIEDLGTAKKSLATLSENLGDIDNALPNSAQIPQYLKGLESDLSSNQTGISSIQMEEVQLQPGISKLAPQIIPVTYTLTISGSFDNLRSALNSLEKLGRFTDINSASFSARRDLGESLKLVLKATTYFYGIPEPKAVEGASQ